VVDEGQAGSGQGVRGDELGAGLGGDDIGKFACAFGEMMGKCGRVWGVVCGWKGGGDGGGGRGCRDSLRMHCTTPLPS